MNRRRHRYPARAVAALAASAVVGLIAVTGRPAAAQESGPARAPQKRLDAPRRGKDALAKVRQQGNVADVAALNKRSVADLEAALSRDEDLWLDDEGRMVFVDQGLAVSNPPAGPAVPEPGPYPNSQTFLLHSRPTSTKKIYLDFDGYSVQAGGAWANLANGGGAYTAVGFDLDGSPGTWNQAEHDTIQSVWQRVAEDYAVFDVDVTTQDPGFTAIDRASAADANYGTVAVITNTTFYQSTCSCGGAAYVGVFDSIAPDHYYYQPAMIFQRGLSNGTVPKYLAEATSHEVGHNLGLSHDGTSTVGYYAGHGSWAPIMGVGYYLPITQFSRGEYTGANNLEDDLAVMQANGLVYIPDDHGETAGASTNLGTPAPAFGAEGIIHSGSDYDWFQITATGPSVLTATVNPAPTSPNLDARLYVYNSALSNIAASDPAAATVNFDVASGLNASVTVNLPAAGQYYLRVDDIGFGVAANTGYSLYGSIGKYTLSGTVVSNTFSAPTGVTATTSAAQTVNVGWTPPSSLGGRTISGYRIVLTPTSGTPLVINTGVTTSTSFSGVPSGAYGVTVTARATNGDLSAVSSPPVNITVVGIPLAPTGVSITPTGWGGNATVSWTAPTNNGGAAITWYRITLTPTDGSPDVVGWATGGSTSQTLYGLRGKTYAARVAGYSTAGVGLESAPSANTVVAGVPGGPLSGSVNNSSGLVTWTAPSDTGGSPVLGYRVMLVPAAGGAPITAYLGAAATSHTFTQGNGSYIVQIAAYNAAGLGATLSSTAVPFALAAPPPPSEPGAPTGVTATGTGSTVSVSWTPPSNPGSSAITFYRITLRSSSNSAITGWAPAGTSGAVYYVPSGTWTVSVAGYNSVGLGAESAGAGAVTTGVPGAPASANATPAPGIGSVDVSWTAPTANGGAAIDGYRITLQNTAGGPPVVRYAAAASSVITIITAAPGTYTATVEAFNVNGLGLGTTTASFTITNNFAPTAGPESVDPKPPVTDRPALAPVNPGPTADPGNPGSGGEPSTPTKREELGPKG